MGEEKCLDLFPNDLEYPTLSLFVILWVFVQCLPALLDSLAGCIPLGCWCIIPTTVPSTYEGLNTFFDWFRSLLNAVINSMSTYYVQSTELIPWRKHLIVSSWQASQNMIVHHIEVWLQIRYLISTPDLPRNVNLNKLPDGFHTNSNFRTTS